MTPFEWKVAFIEFTRRGGNVDRIALCVGALYHFAMEDGLEVPAHHRTVNSLQHWEKLHVVSYLLNTIKNMLKVNKIMCTQNQAGYK